MQHKDRTQSIQSIIKDVIRTLGGKRRMKQQKELSEIWTEISGKKLSSHTQLMGVRKKVIQVKVDSVTLMSELSNFKRQELLAKIREKTPGKYYLDIKFIL
jgi:predicted nucleic acid-binding Zn ribbon protein